MTTALYLNRVLKSSATFNSLGNQEETEPNMKPALLIQSIILPAIIANLLTVDLVAPLNDGYKGLTVTGKNQSSDEKPVTMSQIPDDKAVCLGEDGIWTWYCGGGPSVRYIDRIGFAAETQDPRTLTLERHDPDYALKYLVQVSYMFWSY
jgi:hypothetical protein